MQPIDILILSNAPGELATWVRPVVRALRRDLRDRQLYRISLVLSPCPHATGKEAAIARSYPEIDRVQDPEHFWNFLLWGKTAQNWHWHKNGVVVFLGGDQFFTVILGKRLGYRTLVYAEWETRWQSWIDRFALMNSAVKIHRGAIGDGKFTVVGDLIADVALELSEKRENQAEKGVSTGPLIGLLPGSKPAKLAQGVPLCLAIAERIQNLRPDTRFAIPVAPTLDLQTLARFAHKQHNPLIAVMGGIDAQLTQAENSLPVLQTPSGLQVQLWTRSPAYDRLSRCSLCLTTVGANTAELGSLAIPAIVLLPTQQLDAMRAWDGLPGILANLPLVGSVLAKGINALVLRQGKLFAWPNIWAGEQIVPELVGHLQPDRVAQVVLEYLEHPERLAQMRDRLRAVRGQPGASDKLAQLLCEEVRIAQQQER